MNQQELEALLAQIAPGNNPGRLSFTEETEYETKEVPDPTSPNPLATIKQQVPRRVLQWVDRGTGQTLKVQLNQDGSYTKLQQGIDEKNKGAEATTAAQRAATAGATEKKPVEGRPGVYLVTTKKEQPDGTVATETHYENDAGQAIPQPAAPPQVVPGTLNTQSPRYGVMDTATGQISWQANPNYQRPDPKAIPIPPNQKWVIWDNGDGTTRTEKNPNYQPPSKIEKDQTTGRFIEITEDAEGKPVIRPVNTQTVIKPADLPVLQARFGEIAQGLGNLAQDLNGRVARGEMTPEERTQAFTAAHQQAQTAVAEINSILQNSQSAWTQAVTQRGQTLGETQSRRSFANSAFGNAFTGALSLAQAGGGAASAGAFRELLGLQQKYAEGMGGFRESPEIPQPASVQQVQGIGIPGYPMPGSPTPASPGGAPPSSPPNALGLGAIGAVPAPGGMPAASAPAPAAQPLPWTGGATPPASTLPYTGQAGNPTLMSMGARMTPPDVYDGFPRALGGPGVFDHAAELAAMGQSRPDDPAWQQALARALEARKRPVEVWH